MQIHWGVDTSGKADDTVHTPGEFIRAGEPLTQTRFEYVTRRAGRPPEFWGRYLGHDVPGRRVALTIDEVNYIHTARIPGYSSTRDCRILPIWASVGRLSGWNSRALGEDSAARAILAADSVKLAANTRIYADVEQSF